MSSQSRPGFNNPDTEAYIPLTTWMREDSRPQSGTDALTVSNITVKAINAGSVNGVVQQVTTPLMQRHHISDPTALDFSAVSQAERAAQLTPIDALRYESDRRPGRKLVTAGSPSTRREVTREVAMSILLGGVAPFVIYSLLRPHTTEIRALLGATTAPLLQNLISLVWKHTLDVFGTFILAGIVLSVILVLLGGSPKLILIRESFLTGATGLAFLLSLLLPRPLIFYFARRFMTGEDPARRAEWEANWQYPYFRFIMRLETAVWGVATVVEAVTRTYLVFQLPTQTFLAVSPFIQYGIIGAMIASTIWYSRHAGRKAEVMRRQRLAAAGE